MVVFKHIVFPFLFSSHEQRTLPVLTLQSQDMGRTTTTNSLSMQARRISHDLRMPYLRSTYIRMVCYEHPHPHLQPMPVLPWTTLRRNSTDSAPLPTAIPAQYKQRLPSILSSSINKTIKNNTYHPWITKNENLKLTFLKINKKYPNTYTWQKLTCSIHLLFI